MRAGRWDIRRRENRPLCLLHRRTHPAVLTEAEEHRSHPHRPTVVGRGGASWRRECSRKEGRPRRLVERSLRRPQVEALTC